MATPSTAARLLAALLLAASAVAASAAAAATGAGAPIPLPGALALAATTPKISGSGTAQQIAFLGTKAHASTYKLVGANETAQGGFETTLGGLPVYLALPAKATKATPAPAAAIVLYSDIFGYRGNGTRKIADRLAAEGYVAVMPDFFANRSAASGDPADRAFILAISRADVERGAASVTAALRKRFPSLKKTGAFGWCWGGRFATIAAGDLFAKGSAAAADAAVAFHASLVAPEEFAAVSRPLLFVNAAADPLFNETLIAIARSAVARNAARSPPVAVEIKTFEGVRHGFAARFAPNDTVATGAAAAAYKDGVAFLKRHGVSP